MSVLNVRLRHEYPLIASARGAYLYGSDGTRYLDAAGGLCTSCIGYGVPEIVAAHSAALQRLSFLGRVDFSCSELKELADVVLDLAERRFGCVGFYCGGSEAVEAAIKLARQYQVERGAPGRFRILCFANDYHGVTLGALSTMGPHSPFCAAGGWAPLLSEAFIQVPMPRVQMSTLR